MHGLDEALLYLGQFDVGLVAAFTLHLGGDAADNDDGIGLAHLLGKVGEVDEDTLADVSAEHGEVAVAVLVFDLHVVGLAFLDRE